jgi:hypothetical protein
VSQWVRDTHGSNVRVDEQLRKTFFRLLWWTHPSGTELDEFNQTQKWLEESIQQAQSAASRAKARHHPTNPRATSLSTRPKQQVKLVAGSGTKSSTNPPRQKLVDEARSSSGASDTAAMSVPRSRKPPRPSTSIQQIRRLSATTEPCFPNRTGSRNTFSLDHDGNLVPIRRPLSTARDVKPATAIQPGHSRSIMVAVPSPPGRTVQSNSTVTAWPSMPKRQVPRDPPTDVPKKRRKSNRSGTRNLSGKMKMAEPCDTVQVMPAVGLVPDPSALQELDDTQIKAEPQNTSQNSGDIATEPLDDVTKEQLKPFRARGVDHEQAQPLESELVPASFPPSFTTTQSSGPPVVPPSVPKCNCNERTPSLGPMKPDPQDVPEPVIVDEPATCPSVMAVDTGVAMKSAEPSETTSIKINLPDPRDPIPDHVRSPIWATEPLAPQVVPPGVPKRELTHPVDPIKTESQPMMGIRSPVVAAVETGVVMKSAKPSKKRLIKTDLPDHRNPLPDSVKPPIWAQVRSSVSSYKCTLCLTMMQTRQEMCEAASWFKSYQSGVYHKGGVVYGYLLGGHGSR